MIYNTQLKDVDNSRTYQIEIITPSGGAVEEDIYLNYESPAIISYSTEEDMFAPIKTYGATISLLSQDYKFDLYNISYNVKCKIYDDDNIYFHGYVTPNTYSTDYNNYSQIMIECISPIAMLKYKDYSTIGSTRSIVSFAQVFHQCIKQSMIDTSINMYVPTIFGFNDYYYGDVLDKLYIDENNFFDDDEEQTPWKCYDVLAEICKYLNVTLYEHNNNIYLISYRWLIEQESYDACMYTFTSSSFIKTTGSLTTPFYNITANSFKTSDNSLSLSETYNKIKVKVNTYPYDSLFTDMMDTKYWHLMPYYNENVLRQLGLIPQVAMATNNSRNGIYNFFFYYFYSEKMTPYRYKQDVTITPDPLSTDNILTLYSSGYDPDNNAWLDSMNSVLYMEDKVSDVGCSLMQSANYEIDNETLVSSLNWAKTIVLSTGIGNYTIGFNEQNVEDKTIELCQKLYNYLAWCSRTINDVPNMKILELESESDILVAKDCYLCINGSIGYFSEMYEDPSIKTFIGQTKKEKTAFKRPFSYYLIDQKDDDRRQYLGFPIINIQIEIGSKILVQYPNIVESTNDQNHDSTEYIYEWEEKGATHNLHEYGSTTIISIPVGTTEFGYFSTYDITNTCDWRLGVNKGKGFAIPLPADAGLSGKMKVTIINASADLVYRPADVYNDNVTYVKNLNSLRNSLYYGVQGYEFIRVWKPDNDHGLSHYTWTYERAKIYKGYFPNYIIIKDLSFKIYDVCFISSFEMTQEVDNKDSDHTYQNIINASSIEDYSDIELKINTQVEEKNRSFSSVLYKTDDNYDNYDFVKNMSLGLSNYKVQENNIIDAYVEHYSSPKVMFDCSIIPDQQCLLPYTLFNSQIKDGHFMILNGGDWDLGANKVNAKLVEF